MQRLKLFNQSGQVNAWVAATLTLALATLTLGGLSLYYLQVANRERATVDEQAASAAEAARIEQKQIDEAEFAEREKEPYRAYTAPTVLISLTLNFPKNWNIYVEETASSTTQLNVYANPALVLADKNYDGPYALRVRLERSLYTNVVNKRATQVEKGELTATPITIAGLNGTRYSGMVEEGHNGIMVILPVRDKTLTLWTESQNFAADFNQIIERLTISP